MKFDSEDIDWDDIEKQIQEEEVNTELHTEVTTATDLEENQPYIIHTKDDVEAWNTVEYNKNVIQEKPITGKDLTLEIKK